MPGRLGTQRPRPARAGGLQAQVGQRRSAACSRCAAGPRRRAGAAGVRRRARRADPPAHRRRRCPTTSPSAPGRCSTATSAESPHAVRRAGSSRHRDARRGGKGHRLETVAQGRRVVVVGQGYVGLPLAMRAVEVGHDRGRLRRRQDPRRPAAPRRELHRRRHRRRPRRRAGHRPVPPDATTRPTSPGSTHGRGLRARPRCATARPTCSYIEDAAAAARPARATRVLRRARVHDVPRHDRGGVRPDPGGGVGLRAGARLPRRLQPRAHRPEQPDRGGSRTPRRSSPVSTRPRCAPSPRSTAPIVDRTVPAPGTREAELAKLLENTFRHVNIALVNELAIYCHELGIDVWSVIDAAATKPFGFMRFTPGPGVGGHCLPIDPSYLSWQVRRALGRTFRFVEIANDVNDNMPDYVVTRVIEHLNRQRQAGERQLGAADRAGLQAQLRRRPAVARDRRGPAAGRPRAPCCARSIPLIDARRTCRPASSWSTATPERRSRPPTWSSSSPTTTTIDWELVDRIRRPRARHPQPADRTGRRPALTRAVGRHVRPTATRPVLSAAGPGGARAPSA